jgi:hypothetical protein
LRPDQSDVPTTGGDVAITVTRVGHNYETGSLARYKLPDSGKREGTNREQGGLGNSRELQANLLSIVLSLEEDEFVLINIASAENVVWLDWFPDFEEESTPRWSLRWGITDGICSPTHHPWIYSSEKGMKLKL